MKFLDNIIERKIRQEIESFKTHYRIDINECLYKYQKETFGLLKEFVNFMGYEIKEIPPETERKITFIKKEGKK